MFRSLRTWMISILGGYPDTDTAIDAIRDTDDFQARSRMLTLAVKRLYNTIDGDDILHENEHGQWIVESKPLSKGRIDLLIAEAKTFLGTELWKILQDDVKYQANRKMFITSKDDMDLILGKSWLFVLDCLATRLKSIDKGSATFNK